MGWVDFGSQSASQPFGPFDCSHATASMLGESRIATNGAKLFDVSILGQPGSVRCSAVAALASEVSGWDVAVVLNMGQQLWQFL